MNTNDSFDLQKSLQERYLAVKKGARENSLIDYDSLLILIRQAGSLSMNELSAIFDVPPQNIHVKLDRLLKYGLIERERRKGRKGVREYQHFLAADVDPAELQALTGDELPSTVSDRLRIVIHEERIQSHQPPLSRTKETLSTTKSQESVFQPPQAKSAADQLISKLPDFDPTWSKEMQNRWMASFEAITKRLTEESDN
ncbi:MarR family transcriptional regulator [Phormidium tenue]|uniref:HTH marR-type domain-containing protein n=1 Tax=Phormidium tenue NIES-30 TaxID=549789 RepID=A0A1U7J3D6_9CYAN|nr:MarR family transcriptional regulator [Phormidium tenue]MBD2233331.1 hypothetical protein [Phormidium tenue FACHB-1052]OKH46798.1 hypothetical protein NIES30_14910 [Phormidium tenue NIES-30]